MIYIYIYIYNIIIIIVIIIINSFAIYKEHSHHSCIPREYQKAESLCEGPL